MCQQAFYSRYMADSGSFEKLVTGLSLNERQGLLEKLKTQSTLSKGPLYYEDDSAATAYDIQTKFSSLPWFSRFWYFILGFFKSKPPLKIFEEKRISILGNMVEERTQGLYDYEKAMLLPAFFRQITRLKEAAHFFYSALDSSVNRDRGAFFAFLGSLEMPDVHNRLQEEATPEFIAEKNPDASESEMRQMAHKTMDESFSMITEEYRNSMYFNARTLNCLKELSSFLYDRVLMSFNVNNAVGGEICSAGVVRDLLINLNNLLFSLKVIPPLTLLESLFVFILQERASELAFDSNRETRLLLAKAEDSIAVIREFNKQVPLTWILRCSTRNMSLSPKEISGGEDWFVIYRDYWKRRIDFLFTDYVKDRLHRELQDSFQSFFKGKSLRMLENAQSPSSSEGLPIKGAYALSFLYTFYSVVFIPNINWVLRTILIDGEWKKKENRSEFAESFNNLVKLEDEISKFEHEISPSGDYGKRFIQAKQDMSALPVKRRKIQIIVEEATADAQKILEFARDASESIVSLLNGILGNDIRGKYDTLSNLAKISGKSNQFIAGIIDAIGYFEKVNTILGNIEAMEQGR
jgi:hypothetical protein